MSLDIKIFSYLILILPISIATGPFIPDLIASLLAIFYLYTIFRYNNYELLKNKIVILVLIFSLYILVRSLLSEDPYLSLESSLFYSRFIFFSLAIAFIFKKNKNIIKYFSYSILFSILFVVVDAYIQLLFGQNIFGISNPGSDGSLLYNGSFHGQLTGIFGSEQILGSYLARMTPLAFAFIIIINRKFYTLLLIFLIISSDVAIYLSGERSAFFLLIFSIIIIIFLTEKWKILRLVSFIFSIFLIALISVYDSTSSERMINKTLNQLGIQQYFNNEITQSSNSNVLKNKNNETGIKVTIQDSENILTDNKEKRLRIFSKHHENHYFSALKMFRENMFFGIGPKLFRIKCSDPKYKPFDNVKVEDICSTHPHNTYIQLLAETGLVGFLLIFPLFLFLCYKFLLQFINIIFYKKYLISDMEICILASLFIFLFPLIPTGSAFNNWLSVLHYMGLGFYFSLNGKKNV